MAGDWIKVEENMPDKPEVAMIAEELGIEDTDTVAGKLLRVWIWATRNCNGDGVTNVTAMKHIDRCASVSGFAKAMRNAGWILVDGQMMTFPHFGRHCSQTAKERALTNKRVQRLRAETCNGDSVTKPLPEKRREEKRRGGGEEAPPPLDFPEPPPFNPNRIATFEQVKKFAEGQMPPVASECYEAFFDRMESEGWITKEGHPLNDWRARFRTWAGAWQSNAAKPNLARK